MYPEGPRVIGEGGRRSVAGPAHDCGCADAALVQRALEAAERARRVKEHVIVSACAKVVTVERFGTLQQLIPLEPTFVMCAVVRREEDDRIILHVQRLQLCKYSTDASILCDCDHATLQRQRQKWI
jgi:hypothetical protein